MIIETIWTNNAWRNYNYLIACEESAEALAVDPLAHDLVLAAAQRKGWRITTVVNTHEHGDHIGGNRQVIEKTGAQLLAHHNAKDVIPGVDQGLKAGDKIQVGRSVKLEVLDTPGHTMKHVSLMSANGRSAIFCGDTLFNAGVGNCHNGGHPEVLFETYAQQLSRLNDATEIYPGHDYLVNNLRFTLDREPDNARAAALLKEREHAPSDDGFVTTIGLERQINTFLRLDSPGVINKLCSEYPDLGPAPDAKTVFLKLRELRNSW